MKQLSASAAGDTPASLEQCFELVSAVGGYSSWHPDAVTSSEVIERDADGLPITAKMDLHVAHGFLTRDFHLNVAVLTERPTSVKLSRIPHDSRDKEQLSVEWQLTDGARTRLEVKASADLSIPGFMPVGGIAESLAQGFLDAAIKALS